MGLDKRFFFSLVYEKTKFIVWNVNKEVLNSFQRQYLRPSGRGNGDSFWVIKILEKKNGFEIGLCYRIYQKREKERAQEKG